MIAYQIFSHSVGLIGIVLNIVLLYFAICKSPSGIKTYSIVIINLAFTDLMASFCTIFMEARMIEMANSTVIVSYGICTDVGAQWCFYGYVLTLHLFLHSQFILLYSFCYRLYSLKYGTLSKRNVILGLIIIYIPSVIQFISFSFTIGDPKYLLQLLFETFPQYRSSIDLKMVTGIDDLQSVGTILGAMIMTISPVFIYPSVILIRRKIIATLNENSKYLRHETKLLHRQLLKILTFQSFLPLILVFGLIIYSVEKLGLCIHPFFECAVIGTFEILPMISPIIYLYYVTPYHRAIMMVFGFDVAKQSTEMTTQTVQKSSLVSVS